MGTHLSLRHVLPHASLRVSLAFLAATFGAGIWVASSGASDTAAAHSGGEAVAARALAISARTLALNLTVDMHLIGRPGHVLDEQGTVSGSLSGSASSKNTSLPSNEGTTVFTVDYTKGGSMTGKASSHGRVIGPTAYFTGTATITGGTGVWAHARGSHLKFTGVMDRQNYRVEDHVTGTISY